MIYLLNTERFDDALIEKVNEAEKNIFSSDGKRYTDKLSVCGRVLLGYALNKNFGINSYSYRYGVNGKPYLENSDTYFSISHSGDYVMCTVSDKEAGCDVEKIKGYNPKIAKRFFTAKEYEALEKAASQDYVFAKLWTLKESILKKLGTGIGGGLDTYCFADYVGEDEFFAFGCCFMSVRNGEYMMSVCSSDKQTDAVAVTEKEIEEYINKINQKNT